MFDKSLGQFPIKSSTIFLNSCGVAPLFTPAAERCNEIVSAQRETALGMWQRFGSDCERFRDAFARLLSAPASDVAFVQNTSEGINHIANGFPFEAGDEVISYIHEYPSNHYPWRLQERRGVVLKLLPDVALSSGLPSGRPRAWAMEDLKKLVTSRTKMVALSHVQFTSGFAAPLEELGNFCAERGIWLVIDAAQSLGVLQIEVQRYKISALASSGWKWMLGPAGTGVLYTSAALRKKLAITQAGPYLMTQGEDYLNHAWQPHEDARRFEYSTPPLPLVGALAVCAEWIGGKYGAAAVAAEARGFRRQLREELKSSSLVPADFGEEFESGIMSYVTAKDPVLVMKELIASGVTCSSRGGYLRFAPHFFTTADEIERAAFVIKKIVG
jgi:cysteine desulfurase/selenocysteine lyase